MISSVRSMFLLSMPEMSLIRKKPASKVKQKVMIRYTISYWNVVKTILKKIDMAMFGVK